MLGVLLINACPCMQYGLAKVIGLLLVQLQRQNVEAENQSLSPTEGTAQEFLSEVIVLKINLPIHTQSFIYNQWQTG